MIMIRGWKRRDRDLRDWNYLPDGLWIFIESWATPTCMETMLEMEKNIIAPILDIFFLDNSF